MSITPISDPLAGERVIGLSPENTSQAEQDWLRRPNVFPGRALTVGSMELSQGWQAGHLAMRGRDWVAGVVDGFEVQAKGAAGVGFAAARLSISQGRGLAVSGEDVVLQRPLDCLLADVPVIAPPGFFVDGSGVEAGTEGAPSTLRPRSIGATLGALAPASLVALLPIGVLVLQPVTVDTSNFDPLDPCEHSACDEGGVGDPAAFADWRTVDSVRLLWYVWPGEWRGLPVVPAAQLRNALAWTVFEASEALPVADALPWEDWGVPVAMVALDAAGQIAWLDRASVVRAGGRARDARLHVAGSTLAGDSRLPSLWQARIEQLAEQIAAAGEPAPPADVLADAFGRFLPPVGLIPLNAYDPAGHASGFFPSGFDIDAAPVPVEQLDLAVRASARLAPFNLAAPESVRILVPVPLQSWEPRLLQTELIDPEFQLTLDENLLRRARTLGLRQGLRNEAAMLVHALDGQVQTVAAYNDDPLAMESESLAPWGEPPSGGGHRSSLLADVHQHSHQFEGAATPFPVRAGESLFVWVCLDPDNPPRCLMLQWHLPGDWEHRAYWGEDLIPMGSPDGSPAHYRAGDLPPAGEWRLLKVPTEKVALEGKSVDGMAFMLYDGRAAYGLTGARTDLAWRKWFCNFIPLGALVQGNEPWDLLSENDLWAPFEARDGVVPSLPKVIAGTPSPAGGPAATPPTLAVPSSGFNLLYPVASGWRGHSITTTDPNGLATIRKDSGDSLQSWVYLDELQPPRALWAYVFCIGMMDDGSITTFGRGVMFWGENHLQELIRAGTVFSPWVAGSLRGGALPQSGTWMQLQLPLADFAGLQGAVKLEVKAVVLLAYGGNLAFSELTRVPGLAPGALPAPAPAPPERIWPKTIVADGTTLPPYGSILNATLVVQDDLDVLTPTPSSRIGTVRVYTELINDPLIGKLSPSEQSQVLLRGLGGFVDYLRTRIDRADDIVDFGFAHMQVDIYRVRQLTMGTSDASRLAISPTLAAITKSDSALVVQSQIKDYIAAVKATTPAKLVGGVAPGLPRIAAVAAGAAAVVTAAPGLAVNAFQDFSTRAQLIRQPQAPLDIVYAPPILGLSEVRTTAIADRLIKPPSPEARDYALANRHRTVSSMIDLLEQFVAEDSGEMPALFAGFTVIGLLNDPFVVNPKDTTRPLEDFRVGTNPGLLDTLLKPPPLTIDSLDESTLFSQSISLSDNSIAMLRQLEARLTIYRDALNRCDSALAELNAEIAASGSRIGAVEDDLAESRYDVSVARALLAEETQRILAINTRRIQVLANEVKFLAYVRPRETDNLLATPTHAVDPGLVDAPVPTCLREHLDAPEELLDMLRVVREAPANWFIRLPPIIAMLARVDQLARLVQSAQLRASSGIATPRLVARLDANSALGASVALISARQAEAVAPRLAAVRGLDVASLLASTWQAIRVNVEPVVSFADLAEGGHGRADVAQAAARELDGIRGIVACLHAEFSGVLPVLRLQWAETLSEFDAAPNLRNLASLSRWVEIAVDDRRRMQAYVDWLFGTIDAGQAQAVALINDVVRMCLLLASHAPVDRIIAGRMARPVAGVSPGIRIPLTVLNSNALSIGMQALMYRNDTVVARALVEDMGPLEVSARVIQTASERVDLGNDVRVHFDQAAMVSLGVASANRTLFGR